jgi:hypothetical protein
MATASRAPKENRTMINDIVKLYEEKRIGNFETAENAINRLAFATSNKQRIARAQAEYEKVIATYSNVEPMTGRLARESLEKAIN